MVLALAFFAHKDLPATYYNLELEYFIEAVQWLATHEKVYQNGIGFIGVSYGGQIALQVAAECPLVSVVVAISSPHIILTPVKYGDRIIGLEKEIGVNDGVIMDGDSLYLRDCIEHDAPEITSIEIEVDKIKGKILLIGGNDDMCANATENATRMEARLALHKRPALTRLDYPGTGHLIEAPYMPMCKVSFHREAGIYCLWGGKTEQHSAAQEHSWRTIRDFLKEQLQSVQSKF